MAAIDGERPTPQSTIEAVMHCVRERGLAGLEEPNNVERLLRCGPAARAQIDERIAKLQAAGRLPGKIRNVF